MNIFSNLHVAESPLAVRFQPVFSASNFRPESLPYPFKQPAVLSVTITSHFVDAVTVDSIAVSLMPSVETAEQTESTSQQSQPGLLERQTSRSSEHSLASTGSAASANILDLYNRSHEVYSDVFRFQCVAGIQFMPLRLPDSHSQKVFNITG